MKNKNFLKLSLAALFALALPTIAAASTDVSLAASSVKVKAGDQFQITVTAIPGAEIAYTSKIAVSYDADMVSATSFSFAPTWLALSASGYDAIDNTNGSLVKTAGYPGGLSKSTVFGTITFTALKSGTAVIAINGDTQIFDNNSQNIFSGNKNSVQMTISGGAAIPTDTPIKTNSTSNQNQTAKSSAKTSVQNAPATPEAASSTVATDANTQVAAVAATGAGSSTRTILYIVLGILIIGGGLWFWLGRKA